MERYSFYEVNGVFPFYLFGEGNNDHLTHLQVDSSRRHEFKRHELSLQQLHTLDLKLCITLIDKNI